MKKFRIVELYAGIARTWEAFRGWKRAELGLLVDVSEYARQTYVANHPEAPFLVRDLSTANPREIQQSADGRTDILLGCPPCQGFSDTGKRNPSEVTNRHVTLFGNYVQLLKPKVVVMENVPLLAASKRFEDFILKLETAGYRWDAAILNAALYGSCQSRQRLILVAAKKPLAQPSLPLPTHGQPGLYYSYSTQKLARVSDERAYLLGKAPGTGRVGDLVRYLDVPLGPEPIPNLWKTIGDLQDLSPDGSRELSHQPWKHTPELTRRMLAVPEGQRWEGGTDHYSQSYGRLHRQGLARTVTCSFPNAGSGRFWHPIENRSLTLREAARIQGIEDGFRFSAEQSHSITIVGNALDFALARAAAGTVLGLVE